MNDDNKNDYNKYSDSNEPMNSNDNNNNESVMEWLVWVNYDLLKLVKQCHKPI